MYSYYITILWVLFGLISWCIGRAGQNFPIPKPETLEYLRSKNSRKFIAPPLWAVKLCALPSNKKEVADITFLHMQLGGVVLIFAGGFAGFLVTPTAFWVGVLGSLILYKSLPTFMMRRWPQSHN